MNCLYCGSPNPPSRGSRERKYCSKKCANDYYHKKNSTRSPGWGDKYKQALKKKEQRRKELEEVINAGWVEYGILARQMNITNSGLWHRIKKHLQEGVETKRVHDGSPGKNGWRRYVHPDAIEKLANPYPIPEGFLTSEQAAEYLGYSTQMFQRYSMGRFNSRIKEPQHNLSLPPSLIANHRGSLAYFYTINDLDDFAKNIAKIRKENEKARCRERELLRREKQEQEKSIRLEKERVYQESIKGLLSYLDVANMFGYKSRGPILRMIKNGSLTSHIIRKERWFEPEEVQRALKIHEEKKKAEERTKSKKRKEKNAWKRSRHKTLVQRYEFKMKKKYKNDKSRVAEINRTYWANHDKGIVQSFDCNCCGLSKPYYEFYIDSTYKTGRRTSKCRQCGKDQRDERKRTKKTNTKSSKSIKARIRRIIGGGVKQHISRNRGEYAGVLSLKDIWRKLEEHCGYNEEMLVSHLESQFVGEMSWDNYGKPGVTIRKGDFCWAIDHIKPKNSFHYTSLNDKGFIECWSLENLRPLEWRLNIIKSDKILRSRMNSSFRKGLASKKIVGVWKILPYTPQEAREHFEARFEKGMNWSNYGTYWNIEHIRPQASLPYLTPDCENFKQCWSLSNLTPLTINENLSKNSVWNGIRWMYNDVDN